MQGKRACMFLIIALFHHNSNLPADLLLRVSRVGGRALHGVTPRLGWFLMTCDTW